LTHRGWIGAGPGFRALGENDVDAALQDAEALILPAAIRDLPRAEHMRRHSSLKVLSLAASGYDWLNIAAATENGIAVTNAPVKEGVEGVADMTWALLLAVTRQIPHFHQRICAGIYERGMGVAAWGRTLGIVGLGQIGRAVARRAAGFEMRVLATEPQPDLEFVAEHGIQIALWDIKGQALGVPVFELLGGRCRDHVECFFQPGYLTSAMEHPPQPVAAGRQPTDLNEVRDIAQRSMADGWKYFRASPNAVNDVFNPTEAMRQTLRQLRAVRDAAGDKLELMVDLHTRLSPAEAVWFCREGEPLRVFVIEDPIRSEHPSGYRHLRAHTNVPLAAGEQRAGKWEFRTVIEEELVDFVRPDLCIAGGITEGRKIAAMAETHFIKLLLHNPLGPVCTAASLHLALACENAGPQEILAPPNEMLPDAFECAFELKRGHPTIPRAAGPGVKFNVEAVRRHPAEMTEPPHWKREDGAFTNY